MKSNLLYYHNSANNLKCYNLDHVLKIELYLINEVIYLKLYCINNDLSDILDINSLEYTNESWFHPFKLKCKELASKYHVKIPKWMECDGGF